LPLSSQASWHHPGEECSDLPHICLQVQPAAIDLIRAVMGMGFASAESSLDRHWSSPSTTGVGFSSTLFAQFAMLELHDADAEVITGGGHHHFHCQLAGNNITIAPQFNIAVNLVAFGGSITNIQGNAGFAFA
jgi:hypothetical protein